MYFNSEINNSPQKNKTLSEIQFHLLDNDFGGAYQINYPKTPEDINQLVIHLTKKELINLKNFINLMLKEEKKYQGENKIWEK